MSSFFLLRSSFLIILITFISFAQAIVPKSSTFKLINQGEFGPYIVEYDGNYRALDVFTSPFQLCFYNTTPNAYTLSLRMGLVRSTSLFRWVWEANRGNPVRENATLTFGTDGNLVLADSDGRIAWQTNTSNKGVVGFELLPNGNMVLYDAKKKFIWQSFHSPTDTLLVGQSFKLGGPNKLVSRVSAQSNLNGPYSLIMEPKRVAMYYKSPYSPKRLLYYTMMDMTKSSLKQISFDCTPDGASEDSAYDIVFTIQSVDGSTGGTSEIARPKYNSTLSLLRLGIDGNLRVYTFSDKVDWLAWEATFTLFSRDSQYALRDTECQLPERCGNFGLCEDDQCVACPTPKGLLGWSKNCKQPKPSCSNKYYKIDGVDHFLTKFSKGDGLSLDACGKKCSQDCKCLGYFYHQEDSKCWIAYDLKTLTKVSNGKHVGFIKL